MLWDKLPEKTEELLNYLSGETDKELSDEQLQRLAEKWQQPGYAGKKIKQQQRYDYHLAYQRFYPLHRRRLIYRLMRYAAVLLLPLGLGALAYLLLETPAGQLSEPQVAMVKPGERKAVLKMADGREIELTGQQGELKESNGAVISIDSSGMRYAALPEIAGGPEIENCIRIPRGGEYCLTLSDGTKVWLNAESELKYPVTFSKNKREITVAGEAYLEVAHNPASPFIVKTALGSVQVLGTKFNVQAYRNERRLVTTLVEGKVACKQLKGEKSVILKPDQQVVIDEKGIGEIRTVKSQHYTGWKDGMFIFENERLENILCQLSRWYDVQVCYQDERLKDLHFSGDLSRFKDIHIFFRMFENSADIVFSLKDKILIVSRNKK